MPATIDASFIAAELERARACTEALLAPFTDDELMQQVSPLMSPLVWDYAHIAHFEELWLLRSLGGSPPPQAEHDDVYDALARAQRARAALDPVATGRPRVHS